MKVGLSWQSVSLAAYNSKKHDKHVDSYATWIRCTAVPGAPNPAGTPGPPNILTGPCEVRAAHRSKKVRFSTPAYLAWGYQGHGLTSFDQTTGELTIDLLSRTTIRNEKKIDLQPKEFALLEYLMRNEGHIVSKTMIMERVWDYNFDPATNVVEARISKLRDKIDKDFDKPLIHTVRGLGYVLRQGE